MAVRRAPAVARSDPGRIQFVLAAVGALSILPPYLGPAVGLGLDVAAKVEVVDHVVPGVVVAVCGMLARCWLAGTRRSPTGPPPWG